MQYSSILARSFYLVDLLYTHLDITVENIIYLTPPILHILHYTLVYGLLLHYTRSIAVTSYSYSYRIFFCSHLTRSIPSQIHSLKPSWILRSSRHCPLASADAQDQMNRWFILDPKISERPLIVVELSPGKDQALLIGRNSFLVLEFEFEAFDAVGSVGFKNAGLTLEIADKDLERKRVHREDGRGWGALSETFPLQLQLLSTKGSIMDNKYRMLYGIRYSLLCVSCYLSNDYLLAWWKMKNWWKKKQSRNWKLK